MMLLRTLSSVLLVLTVYSLFKMAPWRPLPEDTAPDDVDAFEQSVLLGVVVLMALDAVIGLWPL